MYILRRRQNIYTTLLSPTLFVLKKWFKINGNEEQSLRDRQRVTLKGKIVKALAFLPTQNNKVYIPIYL